MKSSWVAIWVLASVTACRKEAVIEDAVPEVVSREDRQRLQERADRILGAARSENAKWILALQEAESKLAFVPGLGACGYVVPVPDTEDRDTHERPAGSSAWRTLRGQWSVVAVTQVAAAKSARLVDIERSVALASTSLAELGRRPALRVHDAEQSLDTAEHALLPPWELVVVAEERVEPRVTDGHSFTGGRIKGHAWLYDRQKNAVVCGAPVDATSSNALTDHGAGVADGGTNLDLGADLDNEAFRAAARGMVRVGSRAADAGTGGKSRAAR
jgi:hypothetical protein